MFHIIPDSRNNRFGQIENLSTKRRITAGIERRPDQLVELGPPPEPLPYLRPEESRHRQMPDQWRNENFEPEDSASIHCGSFGDRRSSGSRCDVTSCNVVQGIVVGLSIQKSVFNFNSHFFFVIGNIC
jgi:hypothetical protein